jgi:hypothetical protein
MADFKSKYAASAALTITLASLASSTAGAGRQCTLLDNSSNLYLSALIYAKITVGTTPTLNSLIYFYLIRSDKATPLRTDNAGASDAAITITNAKLLGTMLIPATTSNVTYYAEFDTSLLGELGPEWGIAVVNSSGVALNSTAGNHAINYVGVTKQVV